MQVLCEFESLLYYLIHCECNCFWKFLFLIEVTYSENELRLESNVFFVLHATTNSNNLAFIQCE